MEDGWGAPSLDWSLTLKETLTLGSKGSRGRMGRKGRRTWMGKISETRQVAWWLGGGNSLGIWGGVRAL